MRHHSEKALDPFFSFLYIHQLKQDFVDIQDALVFGFGLQNANKATQECPCGYYNHPIRRCICKQHVVQKYISKISGPLLDRIDIHIEVTPVEFNELTESRPSEKSEVVRNRVIKARKIQEQRFKKYPNIHSNAQMRSRNIQEICIIDENGRNLLKKAMERLNLSARAYDRILKVARTIADLEGSVEILNQHLAEAIHFRSLDRENWSG